MRHARERKEKHGEKQIELLLDPYRPQMSQRREAPARIEIAPVQPGADVPEKRDCQQQPAPEPSQIVGKEQHCRHERAGDEHRVQRRKQPPRPPQIELRQQARAIAVRGCLEQLRNEVARDHEEHIDAEVAATETGNVIVVQDDGSDGDPSKAIEFRPIGQPHR